MVIQSVPTSGKEYAFVAPGIRLMLWALLQSIHRPRLLLYSHPTSILAISESVPLLFCLFSIFMYAYMWSVCVHVECMWVLVYKYAYGGLRWMLESSTLILLPYLLRQHLSIKPIPSHMPSLASQVALGVPSPPSQASFTSRLFSTPGFYMGSGYLNIDPHALTIVSAHIQC